MDEELRQAALVVVALGEHEWEFENALVTIRKRTAEIWYEDDEGERHHVATAPLASTFIAWVELEGLPGAEEYLHDDDQEEGAGGEAR